MNINKSAFYVLALVVFLAMMLGNARSVSTMDQQDSNAITFEKHTISTNTPGTTQVNTADVDGDGDQDILSTSAYDDKVIWFENVGGIPPDFVTHVITDQADLAHSVHAADLDGDADLDILSANGFDSSIEWYENDGNSSPTFTNHTISNNTPDAKFVYAIDADGDGDVDVFSASRGDDKLAWYENDGGSVPSFTTHIISTSANGANMVYATDLDDDGDIDALSASRFDDKIAWYENDGNSPPNFTTRIITTSADDAFTVYAKDVNGDGYIDVLSASEIDRKVAWYENDGSSPPNFTTHIVTTDTNAPIAVYAADLDNDGDNDVLLGSHVAGVSWYENKGGLLPDFETHVIQNSGSNRWVHVEDLDDDGDLDIISGDGLEQSVDWWENKLITGNGNTVPIVTADEPQVAADEGLIATNSGLIEDGDGDAVALGSSVGTVINSFDGTWSWSFVTDDGPEQSQIVTISADDGNGGLSESAFQLTVTNVAPTIALSGPASVDEGSPFTLTLGTVTDPGDDTVTDYIVNWGDGDSETYYAAGNVTHTYVDGPLAPTITVDLNDEDGTHLTAGSLAVTVNNVAPTITNLTAPNEPVNINEQPASMGVEFFDPGVLDTHEVVWDWGDGSSDAVQSAASPTASDHTYAEAGTYTVGVTVTDQDQGFDSATYTYIVIYDPDGGFVTGGGWIISPEGAYSPDLTLTGKANFGFVSKYKKGADTPTGNTEFQFKADDLNFHSDSYDWLVVAGAKAKFKGTGTINGTGNYGFMLSAIDAAETPSTDTDLFRIKIWDKDNGDVVVYDNQPGDDADPTTEIGGGNIIVHKAK